MHALTVLKSPALSTRAVLRRLWRSDALFIPRLRFKVARTWKEGPPPHLLLVAGSTQSRKRWSDRGNSLWFMSSRPHSVAPAHQGEEVQHQAAEITRTEYTDVVELFRDLWKISSERKAKERTLNEKPKK